MICRYFCTFISSCPSWNWPVFFLLSPHSKSLSPTSVCVFVFSTYKSLVNEMSRKQACEKVYNCSLTNPKDEWGGYSPLSIGGNVSGPNEANGRLGISANFSQLVGAWRGQFLLWLSGDTLPSSLSRRSAGTPQCWPYPSWALCAIFPSLKLSHSEAGKMDKQLSVLTALEGHRFNPQHPPGSLQSSTTPALGDSIFSTNLHGDCTDVVHTHTHTGKALTNIKINTNKINNN